MIVRSVVGHGSTRVITNVAVADLLSRPNPPTALFCSTDLLAISVIGAIKTLGLSVPDDISVIGFDDIEFARFLYPRLTTVMHPINEMGKMAASIILNRQYGIPIDEVRYKFEPTLVVRDSVKRL